MFTSKIPNSFLLGNYADQRWDSTGIDSAEFAEHTNKDLAWFQNYPHEVNYVFNSRGFRDAEWPESLDELKNSIWCVGDSFTCGVGVEYEHIWPQLLQQQLNCRTINISLNGASNQWIRDRTIDIIEEVSPKYIILHWSYTHRRQTSFIGLDGYQQLQHNNTTEDEDRDLLIQSIELIESKRQSVKVVHSFIPQYHKVDKFNMPDEIYEHCKLIPDIRIVYPLKQLDMARDKHHYGEITARHFVQEVIKEMAR
jgi:hypothetical protein